MFGDIGPNKRSDTLRSVTNSFRVFFLILPIFLYISSFFFLNDTATTEIYTLPLHAALPIFMGVPPRGVLLPAPLVHERRARRHDRPGGDLRPRAGRDDVPDPRRGGRARQQYPLRTRGERLDGEHQPGARRRAEDQSGRRLDQLHQPVRCRVGVRRGTGARGRARGRGGGGVGGSEAGGGPGEGGRGRGLTGGRTEEGGGRPPSPFPPPPSPRWS